MRCGVLQCVAANMLETCHKHDCGSVAYVNAFYRMYALRCVAVCCRVLQGGAVCRSVSQCANVSCRMYEKVMPQTFLGLHHVCHKHDAAVLRI